MQIKTALKQLPVVRQVVAQRDRAIAQADQLRAELVAMTKHRDRLWKHQAYEPALVPTPDQMLAEGVTTLEGWYRWSEEWSMLLRVYGKLACDSHVLEIGCGSGRIAFALRHILGFGGGRYDGFDIIPNRIDFARATLAKSRPNFRFTLAEIQNTYYNPGAASRAAEYTFPYADASFDVIYAASVFTHLFPDSAARYFKESARVLRPGGRCVFSFFLLDNYQPGRPRPLNFNERLFNFDHRHPDFDEDFAVGDPGVPEKVSAFRLSLVEKFAADAGLTFAEPPVPGMWSGAFKAWIGMQDVVVLRKA